REEAPFARFLDRLAEQAGAERPEALALQGLPAPQLMPGFAEANPMALVPGIAPRLWIGNAAKVAIHHDPTENIAVVGAGRRRFTLFAPEQVGNLYMG
ncbi:cupin-like domain-containing protein, partial [Escherichia coli]|nr:cupin-like domain-containing protein [Escherichia coli]